MASFKCKMCGGTVEIAENVTMATCEYCGTLQPVPGTENVTEEQKVLSAKKGTRTGKKIAIILTCIVCIVGLLAVLLPTVIIPEWKYKDALALFDSGKYAEAIDAFKALDGYKDSNDKILACEQGLTEMKYKDALALMDAGDLEAASSAFSAILDYKDSAEMIVQIEILEKKAIFEKSKEGEIITFGTYEQDNITSNGKEPIEWMVLSKEDQKVFLIAKYAIECKPYNTTYGGVTWEKSTLRKWLNDVFLNSAFTENEIDLISEERLLAHKNPDYSTETGGATYDKVFLLSVIEADAYMRSDTERMCRPTEYAIANGAWTDGSGSGWWWLRTPGVGQDDAACVLDSGRIYTRGDDAITGNNAVRPAIWIDLS